MRLKMKYIALLSAFIALGALGWGINSTRASIDFWMEKHLTFTKGSNSITIYSKNGGEIDGEFYLVLTFLNASFSNQTAEPYSQIDNSTVKSRFLLHKGESNQKVIYFFVNETNRFSIKLSLEKLSFFDVSKANPMYPTELEYDWKEETETYNLLSSK